MQDLAQGEARGEVQAAARYQQKVEELCAATVRTLSAQADLHFRGRRLFRGSRLLPLFAPHLHPSFEADDFSSFRGAADGLGLRLSGSDEALHRELCPSEPVERLLFEMLEQMRVESRVPAGMPGMARNLQHRHAQWLMRFHHSGLTETARGLLLFTVAQICRTRVTGEPTLEDTEDMMETTRGALAPLIGHELAGLRRSRDDQAAYAVFAASLAKKIAALTQADEGEPADRRHSPDKADADRAAFSLVMTLDADAQDNIMAAATGRSLVLEGQQGSYQVFTKAYDREVFAASLVRPAMLREYRQQLDRSIAAQGINVARLARELKALLAQPDNDGWRSDQEEGHIDGRRLARLIASPTERRLFRTEHVVPVADCMVSFLIDCSGSMKQHIESVALLVDVFSRALEQAGVDSEILGYTTGAWNGGRAHRDWQRSGKPQHPGRLNEVSHLIFKAGQTPWRRARTDLAALLKADLFREGVDGEAVDWACSRLALCNAQRKLLIVFSDGCPMDRATEMANDSFYLDNHLRDVVLRQEKTGAVEIFGVGVGLDLSPYYNYSQALDLSTPPGNDACREIVAMLARRKRR